MNEHSLLLVLMAATSPVLAQSGSLSFAGQVTTRTCVVAPGDDESLGPGFLVALPAVSQHSLSAAGIRGAHTPFFLRVGSSQQPCRQAHVFARFRNLGDVTAAGRLTNRGTAGQVEVVVMNHDREDINLNTSANSRVVPIDSNLGYGYLEWYASYYATGAATPGTVSAAVEYVLEYL